MDLRQQVEELLPFYALDALTDEERELVERYLAEHPEARPDVEAMEKTASALPYGTTPIEPPRRVKSALMARVAAEERARVSEPAPRQATRRTLNVENLFRALSLGAATIAILWAIALNMQVARLRDEISALNQQVANQSESINQIITNLPQTNPSNVITVSLRGTESQPQAQGQLITDPTSRSAVLLITGLPPLEAGQTYQVWLIDGGAPVSAGLLTVDENGQGVFVVDSEESISSFNKLGISIEPNGGSPQPTGDIVVLSDI